MEIRRNELSPLKMTSGGEKRHSTVIDQGILKYWIGFGWIGEAPAKEEDFEKFPVVID